MAFNLQDFLRGTQSVQKGQQALGGAFSAVSNLINNPPGPQMSGFNLFGNQQIPSMVPSAQAAAVMPPPQGQQSPQGIDPDLAKIAKKTAEKRFTDNINRLMDQGVDPEQIILSSSGFGVAKQPTLAPEQQLSQALGQRQGPVAGPGQAFFGQGQPGSAVGMEIPGQQMTQPQQSGLGRVLRGLGSLTGLDASKGLMQTARVDERGNYIPGSSFFGLLQEPSSSQLQAQQAYNLQPDVQLAQKIREAELVPLAKARKEELGIAGQNEFFKSVFGTAKGSAPSAESVKLGALSTNALDQLNLLNTTFQKDPDFFKNVNIPGNPKGQILDTIINDLSDSIGRLRSGGAITADEEKRFLSNLPKKGLKGYTEDAETIKFKLARATNMFSGINSALTTKNVLGENIKKALAAGASREQIYRVLGGGQ